MDTPVAGALVAAYLSRWAPGSDTHRTMRSALRSAARVLLDDREKTEADYPWQDLRHDTARAIPGRLEAAGLSPATVNKTIVAVRGVLETAWREGALPDEEYRRIKIGNVRGTSGKAGDALEDEEIQRLRKAILTSPPRDAALLALLLACGLRRVEIARLERDDYDPRSGRVTALGKGKKVRYVPVEPDWKPVVDAHWKTLPPGAPMFSSARGNSLTRSGVSFLVNEVCQRHGLDRFTPHDLRRTFGTQLIEGGVDLFVVQDLMGHSSLDVTKLYDRRNEKKAAEAVAVAAAARKKRTKGGA